MINEAPKLHAKPRGSPKQAAYATATGLLSNQGEKSIDFYFIMVPFRKKY